MTKTPTPEEMTVRLHEALDAAVGLTPDDISNVQSLIDVGEWLVAFARQTVNQAYPHIPGLLARILAEAGCCDQKRPPNP